MREKVIYAPRRSELKGAFRMTLRSLSMPGREGTATLESDVE